jgi:hypothetical protein
MTIQFPPTTMYSTPITYTSIIICLNVLLSRCGKINSLTRDRYCCYLVIQRSAEKAGQGLRKIPRYNFGHILGHDRVPGGPKCLVS